MCYMWGGWDAIDDFKTKIADGYGTGTGGGLTYEEFRRVGRLGCGTCYETFASQLRPLLRRIHGSADHTGGVPSALEGDHFRLRAIRKLKDELTRAVQAEDYERAAELRDTIRSGERELGSTEAGDVDVRDDDQ